jgi:hypothetical protein
MNDAEFHAMCGEYIRQMQAALHSTDRAARMLDLARGVLVQAIASELEVRGDTSVNFEGASWAVYRSLSPSGAWHINFTRMTT